MMRETPRTFVGPTVFTLESTICVHIAAEVRARVGELCGITACEPDADGAVVVVVAGAPVDRGEVLDALRATGCPVRS